MVPVTDQSQFSNTLLNFFSAEPAHNVDGCGVDKKYGFDLCCELQSSARHQGQNDIYKGIP